ncbi:MAG: hypothetical protein UHM08_06520 [Bacteroidales bacterium]|nr:hypothetical protein [Bacteroidales bacterium]
MIEKKWENSGIILNEVFGTNNNQLLPEIINFKKADNCKIYIHLNRDSNTTNDVIGKYCNKFEWMLMIKKLYENKGIYEVIGLASELFGNIRETCKESYDLICENPKEISPIYNGVHINKIFSNIDIVYTAEHVFIPKNNLRIFIITNENDIVLSKICFNTCHSVFATNIKNKQQFNEEISNADYMKLKDMILEYDLWQEVQLFKNIDLKNMSNLFEVKINELK